MVAGLWMIITGDYHHHSNPVLAIPRQVSEENVLDKQSGADDQKVNKGFVKKIPDNAEAALVLEGKLPGLAAPLSVFLRLDKPVVLGSLPEVDVATRFLYVLVSPTDSERAGGCSDTGRAMGTAFSDRSVELLSKLLSLMGF